MTVRGWEGDLLGNLVFKEETRSTNDDLKAMLRRGEAWEGVLVLAERQTAGRGRNGAQWFCEEGKGLAFSVLLKPRWPKERWGWVSLAAGLAVAEAVETLGFDPEVKWPNDLLLGGRKFCGILVESMGDEVVVGIGVNVNGEKRQFPEGILATTLEAEAGSSVSREQVLERIWHRLSAVLQRTPEEVAEAVWEKLAWRDQKIRLYEHGQEEEGRIRAFGVNGELQVETSSGLHRVSDAASIRGSVY